MSDFDKDTYQTPKYLFNWLNKRFNFDFDGCAGDENHLCERYCTEQDNFLTYDPDKESEWGVPYFCPQSIYINPPYSNPKDFVERAVWWKVRGSLVVMLLPADKSVEWYSIIQQHATEIIDIIGYHDEKGNWHTGRVQFIHPFTGEEVKGNNKGSMIAVFDPFVQGLVTRQVSLDFIKKVGGYVC